MPVFVGLLVLGNRAADLCSLAARLVGLLRALEASLIQLGLSRDYGVSGLAVLVEVGTEGSRDFVDGLWRTA